MKVFGPIHGAIFVAYVVVALVAARVAALGRPDDGARAGGLRAAAGHALVRALGHPHAGGCPAGTPSPLPEHPARGSLRSPSCRNPSCPTTARLLLARTARAQREGRAPSLVAGVVRDGGLAWSAGRGEVAEPHTDVQYRLGSISKTVTAVAVMRLRDEGLLHLDDPLDRHLPGTPARRPHGRAAALAPRRRLGGEPGRLVGADAGRLARRPRARRGRRRPRGRPPLPLLEPRLRPPRRARGAGSAGRRGRTPSPRRCSPRSA